MTVTTIAVVVLKIAVFYHSVESSHLEFSGEWYLQRYVQATSNNISCFKIANKVLNNMTVETNITFKLNGESLQQLAYFAVNKVCDNEDKFIGIEYINDHGRKPYACAFYLTSYEEGYAYDKTLCNPKEFEMSELCFSKSSTASQQSLERCPISRNFKEMDNSNC